MNRMLLGYSPELDVFEAAPAARRVLARTCRNAIAFDTESTEQAAKLLEVAGRPGMAQQLGRLVRRSAVASGRALKDSVADALVALLQRAAHGALPTVGKPDAGDPEAGATRASRFFGIELEGLSPEDREFEAARRFVQLVAAAARQAAKAPVRLPPAASARLAAAHAARRHAPGWLRPSRAPSVQPGRFLHQRLFANGFNH